MEKKETETRAKRQTRSLESRVERRRIVIGEREGKIARGETLELRIEQANARSHCFAARPVTQSLLTYKHEKNSFASHEVLGVRTSEPWGT